MPVTGDWDGDGRTGVGVVRGSRCELRNALSAGSPQMAFTYGRSGDVPVTGDWNGDGVTTVGITRGNAWHLRDQLGGGAANRTFTFGLCGDATFSTGSARTSPGVPRSLRGTEWTRLPTTERVVALTIDAGANAGGAPSILATLNRTDTPATFFLTGAWTTRYPTLARQIAASHPIGNHTATHPDLTTCPTPRSVTRSSERTRPSARPPAPSPGSGSGSPSVPATRAPSDWRTPHLRLGPLVGRHARLEGHLRRTDPHDRDQPGAR